ncbi:prolyl oligopeptidase [Polymorphobacter glacialis]|uniref:Prolyl oligopeptidase n=1 Tax=Sandarakinorhabdus glacialis TaxID=1614636 RepID=A0A916ZQE9_9SPHN|nr:S9 family peptidase [Polymorphobacter glacialis]GGE09048.1 prolyl oligopeptidase [Polymorphobacter glacialis]
MSAYGQLPAVDEVTLSPDGQRYAAIVGDDTQAQIQVRSMADGKLISVSAVEKAKARTLVWVGNDHVLALISTTAKPPRGLGSTLIEWYQVQDLDLTTRTSKRLMDKVRGTMNIVTAPPMPVRRDGNQMVVVPGLPFVFGRGNSIVGVSGLYRVDLKTGETVLEETGKPETEAWMVDGDGKAVARSDYDAYKAEWTLFLRGIDGWQKALVESADIDKPELLAIDADGKSLLIRNYRDGKWGVHSIPIAAPPKGKEATWGPAIAGLDPDGLISDPATRRLSAATHTDMNGVKYAFQNPDDQRSWDAISKAFPGEVVTLASWSQDRMVIVVRVQGPANGDGYFVIDRRKREAKPLGSRYPGIALADIGENRVIRYHAADGLEIPAYLTLPPGRATKALPLIVFPHGGPIARDHPGFDWWSQAMASRGYAVLRPQFRGSDGLGDGLREAAWGEYGRKMQTDLSDGVRHLAGAGMIDPARVCIVGASYGGYAALAGVTLQKGVYRCASAIAGVTDLRRFLGGTSRQRISPKRSASQRFWLRLIGAPNNADPLLDRLSPAQLATRSTVPVQLIHGKDDTVVAYAQTDYMAEALRQKGAPVEVVTLEGEDHWLSMAVTRRRLLDALMAFLEKHNPADAKLAVTP